MTFKDIRCNIYFFHQMCIANDFDGVRPIHTNIQISNIAKVVYSGVKERNNVQQYTKITRDD